jgi:hypothetical protein
MVDRFILRTSACGVGMELVQVCAGTPFPPEQRGSSQYLVLNSKAEYIYYTTVNIMLRKEDNITLVL